MSASENPTPRPAHLRDRSPRIDRRRLLALGGGAFVVAAVPFALWRRRGAQVIRRSVPVMGTVADLAVVHPDERAAHVALDAAIAQLRLVDASMSRFRVDSDVGRANAAEPSTPVSISAGTAAVLESALAWAEATDGAFDPCLGRAAAAWEVTTRREPPTASAVEALRGPSPYRALDLDIWRGRSVVRLTDARAALDLGGIAKGYGVDLAVEALRDAGITDGLVNVGGDLYALGGSADGDDWLVGIRSSSDPSRLAGRIRLRDEALATSGDYERCFEHDGHTYHHLLDPRTAAPRETDLHSATVRAATCLAADAGATSAFGLGPVGAERVFGTMGGVYHVATPFSPRSPA